MRERKWVDCPVCGAKGSMRARKGITRKFEIAGGYPSVTIGELDGQICSSCGDGFLSNKSQRKITSLIARHMAEEDAKNTPASEVASIDEAVRALSVRRQSVYKMMNEGRLRYVFVAGQRLPIRKYLKRGQQKAAGRTSA